MRLGDGSIVSTAVYRARARVSNLWAPILVHESEGDILAGMALLEGTLLSIEVVQAGRVILLTLVNASERLTSETSPVKSSAGGRYTYRASTRRASSLV